MTDKAPTPQELEQVRQAKTDPLYIALILRQRLRNAELIREHHPLSSDGSITISAGEADILLKHFSGYAEKNMQLAGELAAAQKNARHANDLIGRVMHLFARDQWRVEKQEDQGWIIHTPRVEGMASHTIAFEDSPNPAEALLALILDAAIETGTAGYEWPTLADALEDLGRKGGDVEL